MGSGTSYFNMTLFRKNLARFWPIWGLYALIWVVLLPAGVLLRRDVWDKGNAWEFPLVLLDGSRNMALVLAFLFGILCAMAVFSYLYSVRSVGMLHALPMRREGLFLTNYLSGLAFLWVPNFGVFLLALAAEALNGTVVFSSLFTWLVVTCLLCLFFYSFAVFCAMFTGHILALPAFYLILNFLAAAITYLLESIAREFLFGFNGAEWAEKWAMWFTPALKLLRATGLDYMSSTPRYCGLGLVVLYALIGLVLAGIALAVYCRRQLERAGDVITVGWVRPVFRYGMALCCAITLGAFFYSIFYPLLPQGPWTLLGWMLLWGAVGCFIAEMLLKKRLWVFKTSWKGCVVFLVCLVAAMATLELDLLGFERKVPDAAQVKAVQISGINSAPYDSGAYLDFSTSDPQTIEEITSLHSSITGRKDELEAVQASGISTESWITQSNGLDLQVETTTSVHLWYELTDGTVLERQYHLPIRQEDLEDPSTPAAQLSRLINQPQVISQIYLGSIGEKHRLVDACLINLYNQEDDSYGFKYLPAELLEPLLEAVQTDLAQGNLGRRYLLEDQERMDNCCYTDLELTFRLDQTGVSGGTAPAATAATYTVTITLQKSAVHTMEVLKDYSYAFLSQAEMDQLSRN
ncbi:MAG TPA: hypothetical protein H9712_10295 [Candidatus Flavonifractor intestinigallinarum]|uniref:Uncharacterized protein n=2 Tax=Flavonifractor TaxID=946234 RepID=A0A9D2MNW5_9FIRM|nr:hypothetical protein [Candidatus Flavonifractor intestinigallinarum]